MSEADLREELQHRSLVIDCHAHLAPPEWASPGAPQSMFDLPAYLEKQSEAGIDLTVFGNNMIRCPPRLSFLDAAKRYNEFAVELTAKHPGRLLGLASTNPFGGDDFLKEAERAITGYGLRGFMINTSVDGEYLDSPKAFDFFEVVSRLDVPVFLHPPKTTIGNEKMELKRLPELVGRPFDTTLTLARMILTGVLERFPRLRLVCAHVGGAITVLPGRLDFGHELRDDPTFGIWGPNPLTKPPSAYIGELYVDTVCFHAPAILCAVSTVGVDRVLLGSDFPPVGVPLSRSVEIVNRLPLHPRDRRKLLGDNAARLLKL
jgi:aminocarboxymuconate-semialdehyde decarboxylase